MEESPNEKNDKQELFQCPICLDILNYPVSMPCGHTVCFSCLQESLQNIDASKCPVCEMVFQPNELRAVYVGRSEGQDPRENIVEKVKQAQKERQREQDRNNFENRANFEFRMGFGPFGGIEFNAGNGDPLNEVFEEINNVVRRVAPQPNPLEGMTKKEKFEYYCKRVLRIIVFCLFLVVYFKLFVEPDIKVYNFEDKQGGKREVYVARNANPFFFL